MVRKRRMAKDICGCPPGFYTYTKRKAGYMLIAGVLIALNAWCNWTDAWLLLGVIIALGSLGKLIMPMCCE